MRGSKRSGDGRDMIKEVTRVSLPVDEKLTIQKNRIQPVLGKGRGRICIVTGIHGDELEGQFVCYELQRRIAQHPECLRGNVDIYPAMNPFGIDTIMRGIPAFDLDMNRIFPGRKDGDMNEAVAADMIRDIEGADLVLDIHASNIYLMEAPQIRINELHADMLVPLAKKSNVDLVWVHSNATVLESTLAYSLNSRGTKTLVVEMGVGMRITRAYGQQLTDGIFAMMKEMDMWDGPVEEVREPIISTGPEDVFFLNAPGGGIFVREKEHGEILRKGECIGRIVNPLTGEVIETVLCPVDGWLFTVREYPLVMEGSLLGRMLVEKVYKGEAK